MYGATDPVTVVAALAYGMLREALGCLTRPDNAGWMLVGKAVSSSGFGVKWSLTGVASGWDSQVLLEVRSEITEDGKRSALIIQGDRQAVVESADVGKGVC